MFISLHQRTPLHVAAYRDNADAVAFLVDKGADINIKDKCDVSERDCCCLHISTAVLGRSVTFNDSTDSKQYTLSSIQLLLLVKSAKATCIQTLLVDKGADVNIKGFYEVSTSIDNIPDCKCMKIFVPLCVIVR